MKTEHLFQRTFDFICQNPEATVDSLPDELLNSWTVQEEETENHFRFFMIAYTLFMIRKTGSDRFSTETEALNQLFSKFQHILVLESLRRKLPLNIQPVKIFDFDNYDENIQIEVKKTDIALLNNLYYKLKTN
ncbi:hypothetical protein M2459_002498 [Parabacteroides sp. PF5-5]|uniref:hypothetical protein n=1 Tax=unclassified Parabacteroides TaxID=2649774 RepID=UPI0024772389|nr:MULTISPECIES: hypothetical protein [unclassified Parabacteroides]MDH6305746.1 hypothetical protein [Parabacteroides sp. PH5-39]MDH6316818.1 hypothetical protein [Parabacteroides sp. PF5-13]MDH6320459.1 hypothetical protein [Parabacteroides sp. PH5-13]MDH6324189.1 hypothetical protein [Parabacteroides sp. PH5-8]MDH6328004.1 hypothetical protein [Parabacteroides sp. PH5-41]